MHEVSCRAFGFFEGVAREMGFDVAILLEGTSLTLLHLRGPKNRANWDDWAVLCDRFEAVVGGPAETVKWGRTVPRRPYASSMQSVTAHFVSARQLYEAAVRWFAPHLYPSHRWELETLKDGRLRIRVELHAGRRPSEAWFRITQGALEAAPSSIGLPNAVVSAEITPIRGTYLVSLPPALPAWRRAQRIARRFFTTSSALGELGRLQAEVTASHEAVIRSEQDFRSALDRMPDAVAILRDERIVFANLTFCEQIGESIPVKVVGKALAELFEPLSREDTWPLVLESTDPHRRFLLNPRSFAVSGRVIEAPPLVTIRFAGEPARLFVGRDVTQEHSAEEERRRLAAQLAMTDRLASLGTLAAGVAHEINNPLTYVLSNLDLVRQLVPEGARPPDGDLERMRSAAEEARSGAERVQHIVRDLRTFARGPAGQGETPVDVEAVMDSAVSIASNEIRHRARLVRSYGKVGPVLGSEARLGQVFLNLLVNAAQAIPEGAADRNTIHVATEMDAEGHVVVEVRDTGPGIPAEIRGRIFDPFFSTKPNAIGTGLGLTICHDIVRKMGGWLEMTTELERGTTFRVVMLAARQGVPVESHDIAAGGPAAPRRARILIVDDEPAVARALARLVRAHEVRTVRDGAEALELLRADEAWDVIFCDVMMPVMSGAELYDRIRRNHPRLLGRIAFMTGGAFGEQARDFLVSVDAPRLDKPFEPSAVESVVQALLARDSRSPAPP